MKIRPVILCGGAGTRLWKESRYNIPKQFIDFGGWCLFEKTLIRIKSSIFDTPIISTNSKYLKNVKKYLKKNNIFKYKIILEPFKKNTAPAILSSVLIDEIPNEQPIIVFSADHLIEKFSEFKKAISKNKKKLDSNNMFIFGVKPTFPSSEFGYFISKKSNLVKKFYEKPKIAKAKKIMKQNAYWNSGMFFLKKISIINNFKKYQPKILSNCKSAIIKSKFKRNTYYLNKKSFSKLESKSFDHAILEKNNNIQSIKLNIPWSDLGSWREIAKMFNKYKTKYLNKKNFFYRPWGCYINLFRGKGFLVKELIVNYKGCLSLQKHHHRSEHWLITQGRPKITINKKILFKKNNQSVEIPKGSIHRIENPFKDKVKIIEIQLGNILKESDIIRFEDIYGRVS